VLLSWVQLTELERLDSAQCSKTERAAFLRLFHCPLLEQTNIRGAEISDEEITALARGCPALKQRYISHTSITKQGLCAVRDHCRKLEYIAVEKSVFPEGALDNDFFPEGVAVLALLRRLVIRQFSLVIPCVGSPVLS
jgi:hypothetical protein